MSCSFVFLYCRELRQKKEKKKKKEKKILSSSCVYTYTFADNCDSSNNMRQCQNVRFRYFNVLLLFLIWTGYLVVLVLVPAQSIL